MKRLSISFALAALAVAACSKSKPETPPGSGAPSTAGAGAGSGSAAPEPIKPYTPAANVPDPIKAAIAASDRSDDDRRLDSGRKPGEVFAFFGLAPGEKVGEIDAGRGYSSEMMARVIGDAGTLYAQNKKASPAWTERIAKPVMKHVVALERPLDDPFGADVKNLDVVVQILNYHDIVNDKSVDRAKMNKAVFDALKSGGVYGVIDSSAAAGHGTNDTQTLHRIDEDVVKQEVTAAGFKVGGESDVMRAPADTRDWNSSPKAAGARRGTSDCFVIKFVKP